MMPGDQNIGQNPLQNSGDNDLNSTSKKQVDANIRRDTYSALRYRYMHYRIDDLIPENIESDPNYPIWMYVDSNHGTDHIICPFNQFSQVSTVKGFQKLPPKDQILREITTDEYKKLQLEPKNCLVPMLKEGQLQYLTSLSITNLDQIRAKCEGNLYFSPQELLKDLTGVISWNQVFRAGSKRSFLHLSQFYSNFLDLVNKRKFVTRFYEKKNKDFAEMQKLQNLLKIECAPGSWPFIPQKFREYEKIQQYVPTPVKRTEVIKKRLESQKEPVQCPDDCICLKSVLAEGQVFCKYNLADVWESQCPNRRIRVECNHKDPEKMLLCRNSEIKKGQRKRLKANLNPENTSSKIFQKGSSQIISQKQPENQAEIEEFMAWGMDLYTRTILFYCLPEIDIINEVESRKNVDNKSSFIQRTLQKALNFLDKKGYDIREACLFIIQNSGFKEGLPKKIELQTQVSNNKKLKWKSGNVQNKFSVHITDNGKNENALFTKTDGLYAYTLLQHKEFYDSQFPDNSAFRLHTKGKGAKCINKSGIPEGTFIVQYFGEMYEPWRWYERQDFIKEILKKKKLKEVIPEFYNIYLEKHRDQPLGYDILVVDPFKKGNFSSRFSHSCNPNCGTIITVSDGKYYIGMYSIRNIEFGEEFTFDYCSMTESSYEHLNSICLCGMEKCRGNYLQLSNSKVYNNLMESNCCFLFRNSLILRAQQPPSETDFCNPNSKLVCEYTTQKIRKYCENANIKSGILQKLPEWVVRWCGIVLCSIEREGEAYRLQKIESWKKDYPWGSDQSEEERQANIELYSSIFKSDLITLRNQNLVTTIDKIKYYLEEIADFEAPLHYEDSHRLCQILIEMPKDGRKVQEGSESILIMLQDVCTDAKLKEEVITIEKFLNVIRKIDDLIADSKVSSKRPQSNSQKESLAQEIISENSRTKQLQAKKLFYFRLCCLCVSHSIFCRGIQKENTIMLSDIIYFYAFTHTYFSPHDYKTHTSEEIKVTLQEILGDSCTSKYSDKVKKKYTSPFIWGQMVSWYKQTIVNPEASLSQDRRGTLSYPLINTILQSAYPFEKHVRHSFLKSLREKPSSSWPPAKGLQLSYRNPHKCYGTVLFESIHSADILKKHHQKGRFAKSTLLDNVLDTINLSLREKLDLFRQVEFALQGIEPEDREYYAFLDSLDLSLDQKIDPEQLLQLQPTEKKPKKKTKSTLIDSENCQQQNSLQNSDNHHSKLDQELEEAINAVQRHRASSGPCDDRSVPQRRSSRRSDSKSEIDKGQQSKSEIQKIEDSGKNVCIEEVKQAAELQGIGNAHQEQIVCEEKPQEDVQEPNACLLPQKTDTLHEKADQ